VGKHETGFARVERDFYPTPAWVTEALASHVDLAGMRIWECACGDGRMSRALEQAGASVYSSDIIDRGYYDELLDFTSERQPKVAFDAITTNPPLGPRGKLAEAFIASGLRRIPDYGFLALLLPNDFDSAKTRMQFFDDCPHFSGKIVLTKRVVWFERTDGKKEAPKENTAWFLWRPRNRQRPTIMYASAPRQQMLLSDFGFFDPHTTEEPAAD
jgi:hypothetical protein